MLDKLYGIDFDKYVCGGIGTAKLVYMGNDTALFYSESEMLEYLAKLKTENTVGNIKVFTTNINRESYQI
jgi:hypothetical protein